MNHVAKRTAQLPDRDRTPLNQRHCGYDAEAVKRYWGALDPIMLKEEKCLLKLDLVFPLLYGGGFLASLLIGWAALGSPIQSTWLVTPVGITILSDWTENAIQLAQLQRFLEGGGPGIQPRCIQIASAATMVKLFSIVVMLGFLLTLVVWVVGRSIRLAK